MVFLSSLRLSYKWVRETQSIKEWAFARWKDSIILSFILHIRVVLCAVLTVINYSAGSSAECILRKWRHRVWKEDGLCVSKLNVVKSRQVALHSDMRCFVYVSGHGFNFLEVKKKKGKKNTIVLEQFTSI